MSFHNCVGVGTGERCRAESPGPISPWMTLRSLRGQFDLNLPAGVDIKPQSGTIQKWRAKVPVSGAQAPLSINRAEVAGSGETTALLVRVASSDALKSPDLYVEGPVDYGFARPVVRIASTGNEALIRIDVQPPNRPDARLAGETVTLTVVDGDLGRTKGHFAPCRGRGWQVRAEMQSAGFWRSSVWPS